MEKSRIILILVIVTFGTIAIWFGIKNSDHLKVLGAVIFLFLGVVYAWNTKI